MSSEMLIWVRMVSYMGTAMLALFAMFLEIANGIEDKPHRARHAVGALAMLILVPIFVLRAASVLQLPYLSLDLTIGLITILGAVWVLVALLWVLVLLYERWQMGRLRKKLVNGEKNGQH